jgi:hypothetical protein
VVEHSLGKGEVESSILSCSTIPFNDLKRSIAGHLLDWPTPGQHKFIDVAGVHDHPDLASRYRNFEVKGFGAASHSGISCRDVLPRPLFFRENGESASPSDVTKFRGDDRKRPVRKMRGIQTVRRSDFGG